MADRHRLSKGDIVDLLLDGEPYARAVVHTSRVVRSYKIRVTIGAQYDYYVVGSNFATWSYDVYLRKVEDAAGTEFQSAV